MITCQVSCRFIQHHGLNHFLTVWDRIIFTKLDFLQHVQWKCNGVIISWFCSIPVTLYLLSLIMMLTVFSRTMIFMSYYEHLHPMYECSPLTLVDITSSRGASLSLSPSIFTLTTPDLSTMSWMFLPFFPITLAVKHMNWYSLRSPYKCIGYFLKVACTSGLKCLYSLVNYFQINFMHIFMKPQINLFQK